MPDRFMPVIHCESYTARFCECDALGFLRQSNYLRWMQEAAFAASAAVGYDFAKYEEMNHLWLVRETDVDYVHPIRYGDEIELKTWVVDFQRFRSRRAYELRKADTGELAARAWTDWIYMDTRTLRPVLIPEEMLNAFLPEGATAIDRKRFQKPPAPAEGLFSYRTQVEWSDIDTMWHVNNAEYLRYIENADAQWERTTGWETEQAVGTGIRIETKQHRIEYRQPAKLGDELEIVTWYADAKGETLHQHYEIRRVGDGALLTQAQALRVFIDELTGKQVAVPDDFLKAPTTHANTSPEK